MRIIDPHVHVWGDGTQFPWAPETTNPPAEPATPEMLLELMQASGVERTVLVHVIHYRWDNRYTAKALRDYPDKFMGVCRVNPQDPSAPDHLTRLTEGDGFRGVRISPSADASGDWFDGPLTDPLFQRAASLGVPLLVLTRPSRLPRLGRLLEHHPDLDVVIDHMADASPTDESQVKQLLDLARFPRVYVKISHTWSISAGSYPWRDAQRLVKRVYDSFGAQRIMWGTDWPVCLSRTTYPRTLSVVRDEMSFIDPSDLQWVLGGTALRLWPFDR